ncbi:MAG: alanine racemase [Deinococcus sp.]|nr:alanine racemase [Deinococcus sp.]
MRAAWLEIDLAALRHNIALLRQCIGRAQLMAVVKGNAYGHGDHLIAPAALSSGARLLGVATTSEGVRLRTVGITAPIVLLDHTEPSEAEEIIFYQLEPTVFHLASARALAKSALAQGRTALVHVKLDSGLHRQGVAPQAFPAFLAALAQLPNLAIGSVFSHFSCADTDHSCTLVQLSCFQEATAQLPYRRHLANSAATLSWPQSHFDLVRCGLALYGLYPSALIPRIGLRPVLSLRARVIRRITVLPGETVGYGCGFRALERTTILLIPLGYADGIPRQWGLGRARALVRGQRLPVVGRVCMDLLFLAGEGDVGDQVTLIGQQQGDVLSADEAAAAQETINYEVTTQLRRLPYCAKE